jgi:pimeloyl-ACP methyl ester carboxylesterase
MESTQSTTYEKKFIRVGDIQLHTVFAGPEEGDPIVFLHGFPEFWYGWRKQINYFAEAGYRVIVPDQRGYNLSDKPADVSAYYINTLADDVKHLVEALGYERVVLVGHDWGAAVAWWVATLHPAILDRLVILNVPYPTVMNKQVQKGNWPQIFKSWYIGFFQLPAMPEFLISLNNFAAFERILLQSSNPGSFTPDDIAEYKIAWQQRGAVKAMLNWYRAMVRPLLRRERNPLRERIRQNLPLRMPVLMLWGENDVALTTDSARDSIDMCENGELIFFPNATHWLQHDEADSVNQMIHDFITETNDT